MAAVYSPVYHVRDELDESDVVVTYRDHGPVFLTEILDGLRREVPRLKADAEVEHRQRVAASLESGAAAPKTPIVKATTLMLVLPADSDDANVVSYIMLVFELTRF
jgi:hypothetical protein